MGVPSLKTLLDRFGDYLEHDYGDEARAQAKRIREALVDWREGDESTDGVLKIADKILQGHGVEAIRAEGARDSYYMDTVALYVNMGDTYAATLIYDVPRDRWWVTTWGDWLEAEERSGRLRPTEMGTLEVA